MLNNTTLTVTRKMKLKHNEILIHSTRKAIIIIIIFKKGILA